MVGRSGDDWANDWLSAVAAGRSTMSQRKRSSVEKHVGSLERLAAMARESGVHLLQWTDDKGNTLIVASKGPFKVIA